MPDDGVGHGGGEDGARADEQIGAELADQADRLDDPSASFHRP